MNLVEVGANQPVERFYRGGARIDAFRGAAAGPDRRPEDWVGSTTALAGQGSLGLSRLPDGRLLADAVAAEPDRWLGPAHVARYGPRTNLLVKLLDAGQRLPVHAHPDDAFAAAHLRLPSGKAEAWYVLTPGIVHLGLREMMSRDELAELVRAQATVTLLGALHERAVTPGEVVYVPPGMLHAIGEGVLLLELQQPADLSILLEWEGFELDGPRDGHLGIGFDRALEAVTTSALAPDDLDALIVAAGRGPVRLAAGADRYFRLERWQPSAGSPCSVARGFGVIAITDGRVRIASENGCALDAVAGATILAPYAAGRIEIVGEGTVLVCRPPAP